MLADLTGAGKLGVAAQLAYWRQHGRFPDDEADLAPAVVGHLAAQVGVEADALDGYDWAGRTGRRHRRLILDHLAVARLRRRGRGPVPPLAGGRAAAARAVPSAMEAEVGTWFARERVGRPGACRLDRILRSVEVVEAVAEPAVDATQTRLSALIKTHAAEIMLALGVRVPAGFNVKLGRARADDPSSPWLKTVLPHRCWPRDRVAAKCANSIGPGSLAGGRSRPGSGTRDSASLTRTRRRCR